MSAGKSREEPFFGMKVPKPTAEEKEMLSMKQYALLHSLLHEIDNDPGKWMIFTTIEFGTELH